jgi:hypothetical protein
MATKQEINTLVGQYATFDGMLIAAVKAGNTAEALDIQLQMGKIREKLNAMGVVTTPPEDEQPS